MWSYGTNDSDGTATVTSYLDGGAQVLVIPSEIDGYTVTGISSFLFIPDDNLKVETIIIPGTVNRITGIGNFLGCKNLKRIFIPESVTSIPADLLSFTKAENVSIYGVSGSKAISQGVPFVDVSTMYSIDTEVAEVTDGMLVVDEIEKTEIQNLLKPTDDYTVSVTPKFEGAYSTGAKVQIKDKDGVTLREHTLVVKGDTNGDGVCDVLDCMLVELARTDNAILVKSAFLAGDIANDGEITIEDLDAVVNKALS